MATNCEPTGPGVRHNKRKKSFDIDLKKLTQEFKRFGWSLRTEVHFRFRFRWRRVGSTQPRTEVQGKYLTEG